MYRVNCKVTEQVESEPDHQFDLLSSTIILHLMNADDSRGSLKSFCQLPLFAFLQNSYQKVIFLLYHESLSSDSLPLKYRKMNLTIFGKILDEINDITNQGNTVIAKKCLFLILANLFFYQDDIFTAGRLRFGEFEIMLKTHSCVYISQCELSESVSYTYSTIGIHIIKYTNKC